MPIQTASQALVNENNNSPLAFRNKLTNGDARIHQRGTGALANQEDGSGVYMADRWHLVAYSGTGSLTGQRSTDAPPGFNYSLLVTVTSAGTKNECAIRHNIEGYDMVDLMWGSVYAKPVTLSFWVKSSVAGTYNINLRNDGASRVYNRPYTINQANTWEFKTLTIPGCTDGSWNTTNGPGLLLQWGMGGSGATTSSPNTWINTNSFNVTGHTILTNTNGATFQVAGAQFESGSVATPFERVDYNTQLYRNYRYYEKYSTTIITVARHNEANNYRCVNVTFKVEKRTTPTMTYDYSHGGMTLASTDFTNYSTQGFSHYINYSAGGGQTTQLNSWIASADL